MTKRGFDLSAATLHIMAMLLMLSDHIWATLLPSQEWMTCIGRIAYPIFAFMIVEGYFHTRNIKKYCLRLLGFALVSEIPFDLIYGNTFFYIHHQNVIWALLLGLLLIWGIDTVRKKQKIWLTILVSVLATVVGFALGFALFLDYYGFGVVTIIVFYFFHGRKWWCLVGQILCLYWLNVEMLGGYTYIWHIGGMTFEIVQQGFALLALIPIWLYKGRQGIHNKVFQYCCYAFYPVHLLVLYLCYLIIF